MTTSTSNTPETPNQVTICPNCGEPVDTLFCPNCGQQNRPIQLTWKSLASSFMSKFLGDRYSGIKHHNARFGVLDTLRMLFMRPGTLISEYIAGRHTKYYDPVTLLLLLSTLYLFCHTALHATVLPPDVTVDANNKVISEIMLSATNFYMTHPWLWFMLQLPITALVMKWFFRRRSTMRYMDYLYVGIFLAIFSLTLQIVQLPITTYITNETTQMLIIGLLFLLKTFFMLIVIRKLYQIGTMRSLWNSLCIQMISGVGAILLLIAVGLSALFLYLLLFTNELQ